MIDELIMKIRTFGIEGVFRRYYGMYRAVVEDVDDPKAAGRIRVRVPALGQKRAPRAIWAKPAVFGGSRGTGVFHTPSVKDLVWVSFEAGNPDKPLYFGGFMADDAGAPEFSDPLRHGIKTPAGHVLRLSDDPSAEEVTIQSSSGASVTMTPDGGIEVASSSGARIRIDPGSGDINVETTGGPVNITSSSVHINGGTVDIGSSPAHPLVLGPAMVALFNAHTHMSTAPGTPTTPPVTPMTNAQLSSTVRTS